MNILNLKISEISPSLNIGFGGENGVTAIAVDFGEWVEEFGEGVLELIVRRSMDSEQYAAAMTFNENVATLTVSDVETSYKGNGEMQYVYTVGEVIKKSPVFGFNVSRSLDSQVVETPEAFRSWVTQVLNAAAEAKQAVTEAEGYVTEAQGYAEQASASATASAQSATEASGYVTQAQGFAEEASGYAEDASGFADDAQGHAETSRGYASQSATSASEASGYATQASQSANQSAVSATASAQSATESASSATASAQSATEALESAQSAEESAEQAQQTAEEFADEISGLMEDLNTYVIDRYEIIVSPNLVNGDASMTSGYVQANGSIKSSSSYVYTDYLPVSEGQTIRSYYKSGGVFGKHNFRFLCAYDASKTVMASAGSDTSIGTYTVPSGVAYVRLSTESNKTQYMVTADYEATEYEEYVSEITIEDNFLNPDSEAMMQKLLNNEFTTADMKNGYACALPKGYIFRQTVGLPQKWYYSNSVSPHTLVSISAGTQYGQRENDAVSFPNETALNSANGFKWNVYDVLLNLIEADDQNVPYGMDIHIIAENLQSCSALVIGDSTVDFDTMTQYMLTYFTSKSKTLTLLGTLGSGTNKNEGRAGWKATDYLTNKQYEGVVNPFYNSTSETFDFAYYMTNQGYSAPDFVVIQLGINDLYNYSVTAIEPTWNAVKTMIDSIISYNSSIKIILNLPTAPNSDQAEHSVFLPLYQDRLIKYNQYAMKQALTLYGQTKVRPSYCHLILNPDTDIRDNVHPTNDGFQKMAYEVINQINCWQNNA